MLRRGDSCVLEKRGGAAWRWHGRATGRMVKALREAFDEGQIRG